MISKEERAELRELVGAANGEWRVLAPGELVFANDVTNWVGSTERQEDTALVIAAVNAMPVLLDALDAADERIASLEARIAEEGDGFYTCARCGERKHKSNGGDPGVYCDACSLRMGLEHTIDVQKSRIAELEDAEEQRTVEEKRHEAQFYVCEECGERKHNSNGGTDDEACDQCVEIRLLNARIAELEAATQWRPMDTVPTDGTHVVVFMGFRNGAPQFGTRRYLAPPMLGRSTYWRWLPIPALPEGGAK
jgi:DNA-directed RNA polymerase subunit RPC12/RpoP